MMATNYSYGIERDEEALKRNDLDHTKWTNPLETRYYAILLFRNMDRHPLHGFQTTGCTVAGILLCLWSRAGNGGEHLASRKAHALTGILNPEIILVRALCHILPALALTTHLNRYVTEPYGHGDEGAIVDLEVCGKDNTCSGHDLHAAQHMPFSRSWIDRDHSNEVTKPKVCLPRSFRD
jgi:hypothetical protein